MKAEEPRHRLPRDLAAIAGTAALWVRLARSRVVSRSMDSISPWAVAKKSRTARTLVGLGVSASARPSTKNR